MTIYQKFQSQCQNGTYAWLYWVYIDVAGENSFTCLVRFYSCHNVSLNSRRSILCSSTKVGATVLDLAIMFQAKNQIQNGHKGWLTSTKAALAIHFMLK